MTAIGTNIGIPFNKKTGLWSSYWTSRYPSDLEVIVDSDTQITLNWVNNGVADFTGISIERSDDDGDTYSEIDTVINTATTYTDTELTPGVTYYYRIRYYLTEGTIYDDDLVTFIDGLSTELSTEELTLLNSFILTIKEGFSIDTLAEGFDALWIIAGETKEESYRNLAKRDHDISEQAGGRWVQHEGVDGSIGAEILHSDYIPSVDKVVATLNDNSFGCYLRKDRATNNTLNPMGVISTVTGSAHRIIPFRSTNYLFAYNNSNGLTYARMTSTDTLGMFCSNRIASDNVRAGKNKVFSDVDTNPSVALPDKEMWLMTYNNNGSAGGYETSQLSFAWIGKGLDQTKWECLCDAFETYMDAKGKGVIA